MAKDPAFLFYPGDWMGGTQWMTFEQKGCYMELLILQFNTGGFTEAQAKQVLSICFDKVWPVIKVKFDFEDGKYTNYKLSKEIDRRKKFTESRRINASKSKPQKEDQKASEEHMLRHMETETITINNIDNVDKKEEAPGDKKIRLEKRRTAFIQQVLAQKQYDQNMLIAFIDHWTEANRSETHMRFELEKTWELNRRLNTWSRRDKQFNKSKKQFHGSDFEDN